MYLEKFNDSKLDLQDIICGGDVVPTNQGCPGEEDFLDTVTGRISYPKEC